MINRFNHKPLKLLKKWIKMMIIDHNYYRNYIRTNHNNNINNNNNNNNNNHNNKYHLLKYEKLLKDFKGRKKGLAIMLIHSKVQTRMHQILILLLT